MVGEEEVERKKIKIREEGSNKKSKPKLKSRFYNLITRNSEKIRVCKLFFTSTLCISHGPIDHALKKRSSSLIFGGSDRRGRKEPGNKTKPEEVEKVRNHIEKFPVKESHYCRSTTKRKYLDENLSISKMYSLYKEEHEDPVSEITYRRIFGTEYNLSFFVPKKDQCVICNNYKKASPEEIPELQNTYDEHIIRKKDALNSQALHKIKANEDKTFVTISFDLQSVLQIPSSSESQFFFSRKLCAYNLCIYEAALPNRAFCFCWTEQNGQKGSNEIGTCLLKYFEGLPDHVREVSMYSDTCAGQNRNKFIVCLFLYILEVCTNIDIIQHNFFEKGHSHMEADSMHSSIESAKRNISVYLMHDWINVMKLARSNRNSKKIMKDPYSVKELYFNEFLDLKDFAKDVFYSNIVDSNNEKVQWLKIKRLKYERGNPNTVSFSYNYDSPYIKIKTKKKPQGSPKKVYKEELLISTDKKKDLLDLCKTGNIPKEYHSYYESLRSSEIKVDKTNEPGIYDTESEDPDLEDSINNEEGKCTNKKKKKIKRKTKKTTRKLQ